MSEQVPHAFRPDWQRIHTVLLDMDGTLLDLRFDNYFWTELVPLRWGQANGLEFDAARQVLQPRFAEVHGTLNWYCTDYWSRELGLNIAQLKHEASEHIRYLPGAEAFLQAVRGLARQVILVTNAHLDAFAVKSQCTGLAQYLDQVVSSHSLGHPKESSEFWPLLTEHLQLVPEHCLFVDDNLPVLRAAQAFGIGQVFAIAKPDSTMPVRHMAEFPAVNAIHELLP